jgi:hypothetical protein
MQPVFLSKEQGLTTPLAARAFAPVRFAFWIQAEQLSVPFRLMRRIEGCERSVVRQERINSTSWRGCSQTPGSLNDLNPG